MYVILMALRLLIDNNVAVDSHVTADKNVELQGNGIVKKEIDIKSFAHRYLHLNQTFSSIFFFFRKVSNKSLRQSFEMSKPQEVSTSM